MFKWLFPFLLFVSSALAQTCPTRPVNQNDNSCASTAYVANQISATPVAPGSITLTNGSLLIGSVSNVAAAQALSGDCTITNLGVITCTKTGGVAFATLATKVSPVCSDLTNAAASCSTDTTNATNISSGTLANARLATGTTADWEANTASKLMVTDQIWGAGAFSTITFGATTTIDLSTLVNGTITLTGNITTLNWNNCKAGQTGVIEFIQDGTGSRTVPAAWNTAFRWAGGTRGTLSTAINAIDWLFYQCKSSSVAFVSLQKGLAN